MPAAPDWSTGRICCRQTSSVTAVLLCPTSRTISSRGVPLSGSSDTNYAATRAVSTPPGA
jgi:hypothetical protein